MTRMMQIAAWTLVAFLSGCGNATVDSGITFDAQNATDEQTVLFATRSGDTDTLTAFIAQYPDLPKIYDATGNTLLHHAAMSGQLKSARLLLEKGADVNGLNADAQTPLAAAVDRGAPPEMRAFLKDNGGEE